MASSSELTEAQQALVEHVGSTFVPAGPGAGKTRTLVARFISRASTVHRKGVALLSFTNVAVDEVRKRCGSNQRILEPPHFVDTFDSFMARFIFSPQYANKIGKTVRVWETWDRLKMTLVPSGSQCPPFSLEWFDFDGQNATFVSSRVPGDKRAMYEKAFAAKPDWIKEKAAKIFSDTLKRGHASCSAVRTIISAWLDKPAMKDKIISRLKNRFEEIIVDEAQDCGPEELKVLHALFEAGVTVWAVGDLDQSIFEFRDVDPSHVDEFATLVGKAPPLAENFRSTKAICALNTSLRSEHYDDAPKGDFADLNIPIVVLAYSKLDSLAKSIQAIAAHFSLPDSAITILSHKGAIGRKAAGGKGETPTTSAAPAMIARDSMVLMESTSPRERMKAKQNIEFILADLLTDGKPLSDALLELGASDREMHRAAWKIATAANPKTLSRKDYTTHVRDAINALTWPVPPKQLTPNDFKTPPEGTWQKVVEDRGDPVLPFQTIHSAKGMEFDSVCVVVTSASFGKTCPIECWKIGENHEVRRVLYVGCSRARKLLILAVEEKLVSDVLEKLEADAVPFKKWDDD